MKETFTKHGLYKHPLYYRWCSIKSRCYWEKSPSFQHYGGRGIKMCREWKTKFISFYNWCLSNGYKQGLHIDRINNNGNYSPKNCRFVTPEQNASNTRRNKFVIVDKKKMTITQACKYLNLNKSTIANRMINLNLSFEDAITYQSMNFGENSFFAKLTKKDILEIRNSLLPRKNLALIYKCTVSNIDQIINRRSWKNV